MPPRTPPGYATGCYIHKNQLYCKFSFTFESKIKVKLFTNCILSFKKQYAVRKDSSKKKIVMNIIRVHITLQLK